MKGCGYGDRLTKENQARNTQKSTHDIRLLQNLPLGHIQRIRPRRREIKRRRHDQAHRIPQRAKEPYVSPRRVRSNELCIQGRQTKRRDGKDQSANILAALGDGGHFGGGSQGGQLVDAGADARKDHAADDDIHCFGGGDNDHAQDDETGAADGDVAAAEEVGEGAYERAYCC